MKRFERNQPIRRVELAKEFQDLRFLEIEAESADGDLELVIVQFRIFVNVKQLERFPDLVRLIARQRGSTFELGHSCLLCVTRGEGRNDGRICCFPFSSRRFCDERLRNGDEAQDQVHHPLWQHQNHHGLLPILPKLVRPHLIRFPQFSLRRSRILYQRGIYPPNDFTLVKKYGLTLFTSNDVQLQEYINTILAQLNDWLLHGKLSRLVMAIITTESRTTIERWQFDIQLDPSTTPTTTTTPPALPPTTTTTKPKSLAQIQKDIQDIIRQITSSVTFLPAIQEKCLFNILVYTDEDTEIPLQWTEADPLLIQGRAEQVSFPFFADYFLEVCELMRSW